MRPGDPHRTQSAVALGLLALVAAGCSESPYAPTPTQNPCGSRDRPCPLECGLDCARAAVGAAGSCALILEGTFNAARTLCSFPDGSAVRFVTPVPASTPKVRAAVWDFSIERAGTTCLRLEQQRSIEAGLLHSSTSLSGAGGAYQQETWATALDAGAAPRKIESALVSCPGGRTYLGPVAACSTCKDGGCPTGPVLELRVSTVQVPLEFTLLSGEVVSPLFTCR